MINYRDFLDKELESLKKRDKNPLLLLHACCAPCSSSVLEYLTGYFEIIVYYYNPNISDEPEYYLRLSELRRLVSEMPKFNSIEVIDGGYEPVEFQHIAEGLEDEPERGLRCRKCITQRLVKSFAAAVEYSADYFTTTLTVSPHKETTFINTAGISITEAGNLNSKVKYLVSDFKKRNGYKRSIELSEKYGLYRQNYCGCTFSLPM